MSEGSSLGKIRLCWTELLILRMTDSDPRIFKPEVESCS